MRQHLHTNYCGFRPALPLIFCLVIYFYIPSALADNDPGKSVTPKTESGQAAANPLLASVNGKPITLQEYQAHLSDTLRKRYYHGNAPDAQAETVRKEVADMLIERVLLTEEATRRGIVPDAAVVEKTLAEIDAHYTGVPQWKEQREQALLNFKEQIGQQSQIDQIEKLVRNVPQPTDEQVHAYYKQKPELFTEPEKLRLSVILFKVDPSAPKAAWDEALKKAKEVKTHINSGTDFAEQARLHSSDRTAGNGGDLGHMHRGMLPETLQGKIDNFQVGVVSGPLTLMEGIALFWVAERVAPKLSDFASVQLRAQELLRREQQEQAWRDTITHLRKNAKIQIFVPFTADGKQPPSN